MVKVKK